MLEEINRSLKHATNQLNFTTQFFDDFTQNLRKNKKHINGKIMMNLEENFGQLCFEGEKQKRT